MEAARRAPTGGNRQKWRMIVVKAPDLKEKTAEACNRQMWVADAPVILCLITEPGEGKVNGTIVLDHAILAATSLGYGTCWMTGPLIAREAIERVLGVEKPERIVALIPLGVTASPTEELPRKPFEEIAEIR